MARWAFIGLVALTFVGEVAWSAWMNWPSGAQAVAWRSSPSRSADPSAADGIARDPVFAWGRNDATLDAILTSAVWTDRCGAERGKGCVRQDANL